jgi:S1-C subfamily serine protease
VVVVGVDEGSPAARAGLSDGDLIMDVSGKEVTSVSALDTALKNQKSKGVMLRVKRFDPQGNDFVTVVILSAK